MTQSIQNFLLVFDHERGELVELHELGDDGAAAVTAYDAKEREFEGRGRVEVVLLGSDSLDTVRLTHANYFGGGVIASKYLAGI
jgi:hypothetical protein